MRKILISLLSVLGLTLGSVVVAGPASSTTGPPVFASFSSLSAGTLGTASVTIAGGPFNKSPVVLGTPNFNPGSAPAPADVLTFNNGGGFSFSVPVNNPAFYFSGLPGEDGLTRITLSPGSGSCEWSILSGLSTFIIMGGINLTNSEGSLGGSGIVLCTGTVSGVSFTSVAPLTAPSPNIDVALASLAAPDPPTTTTTPAVDPVTPTYTG